MGKLQGTSESSCLFGPEPVRPRERNCAPQKPPQSAPFTREHVLRFLELNPPRDTPVPSPILPQIIPYQPEWHTLEKQYHECSGVEILQARLAEYAAEPNDSLRTTIQTVSIRLRLGYTRRGTAITARDRIWADSTIQALLMFREKLGLDAEMILATINAAIAETVFSLLQPVRRPHGAYKMGSGEAVENN